MTDRCFQDYFPESASYCYGCGRLNPEGLQIKTFWEGEESVTRYRPREHHMAVPGYVYGGVLALLIDCHGTGTAAAAGYRAQGCAMDTEPSLRFVTASLHVDYLKPTPIDTELELRGRLKSIDGRRVTIAIAVYANGVATVRGEVVAVPMPKSFLGPTR